MSHIRIRLIVSVPLLLALLIPYPIDAATIAVPAGGDLQAALHKALPGDIILLQAGATFVGNFVLPKKSGTSYITIRSSAPDGSFPPAGYRIDPRFASLLPKLRSPNTASVLMTATGAHHWRLQFLEFRANSGGYGEIIRLGSSSERSSANQPHHIILDRVYVHGDPKLGSKRGIALNSGDTTIVNSYFSDIKAVGQESQAICGWNGPGPFRLENNYIEAAGIGVMFGGADPAIPYLVPSNITIRRNHFSKNLKWRNPIVPTPAGVSAATAGGGNLPAGSYAYRIIAYAPCGNGKTCRSTASAEARTSLSTAGAVTLKWSTVAGASFYRVYGRRSGGQNQYWTTTSTSLVDSGPAGTASAVPTGTGTRYIVKNLLEFKNGRHVVIEANLFEYSWEQDQRGYAVQLTPSNSGGTAPWTAVQSIMFRYNTVRHCAGGMVINGRDTARGSEYTENISLRHNLFADLDSSKWGGPGGFLVVGNGTIDVLVENNTIDHTGFVVAGTGQANTGFIFINNISRHNQWGIYGDYRGAGFDSINVYFPGIYMRRNVLAGGAASKYPADNFFPPAGEFLLQFVNPSAEDFRLNASSPYNNAATDGRDIGAHLDTVWRKQRGG